MRDIKTEGKHSHKPKKEKLVRKISSILNISAFIKEQMEELEETEEESNAKNLIAM